MSGLYGVDCDDPGCGFCHGEGGHQKAAPDPKADLFSYTGKPDPWPIETGVPISRDNSPRERVKWARPDFQKQLARLEVGQSFIVRPDQCGGAPLIVVQNLASGAANAYCKGFAPGARKFTTRQVGGRFVRVWRTI